jgi:acyl-coenzyme A synthetase/AMP-(fatty) acid ligase
MNKWRAQLSKFALNTGLRRALQDDQLKWSWNEIEETFIELAEISGAWKSPIIIAGQRNSQTTLATAFLLSQDLPGLTIEKSQIASTLSKVQQQLPSHSLIVHESDLVGFKDLFAQLKYNTSDAVLLEPLKSDRLLGRLVLLPTSGGPNSTLSTDCGWLLMTSGTTSAPKLVQLARHDLAIRAQGEIRDFGLTDDDTILNLLPVSHDVGFNQILAWWMAGCSLVVQSSSSSSRLRKNLADEKVTGISGTPLMWSSFLRVSTEAERFDSLRFLTISGGVLSKPQRVKLTGVFPNADVYRTYGQTETFRSLINKNNHESESQGTPVSGVTLRLVDETGAPVNDGEPGQLVHSGAGTMLGYLTNLNDVTEVKTGDFFVREVSGEYRFIGRKDDLIKRWEIRMHLSEVADVIKELPGIADVIVLHRPCDDHRQNELAAFVVLDKQKGHSATTSKEAVMQTCMTTLSASKIPDEVFVIDEFPSTASLKIDRDALRAIWEKSHAQRRH